MLYLQANHLLKDCAFEDIEETVDINSNEDIQKFRRQTSRGKAEVCMFDKTIWLIQWREMIDMSESKDVCLHRIISNH